MEDAQEKIDLEVSQYVNGADLGLGPTGLCLWWYCGMRFQVVGEGKVVEFDRHHGELLANLALSDRDAFDLVLFIARTHVIAGVAIPSALSDVIASYLAGQFVPPKAKRGVPLSKNTERDLFIIWLIEELEEDFGILPTENAERSQNSRQPASASSIISNAFQKAGRHEVTVRSVREVWSNKRKRDLAKTITSLMLGPPKELNALASLAMPEK